MAAIMGLSPWKSAFRVYQEKRKEVADWQGNEATDWGRRQEPIIRQFYSDVTGRAVRLPDKILFHSKHPYMLASLDGYTDDRRVVEIKTARSGKGWGEPGSDEIPDIYRAQVEHYLIVTGFEVADVAVSIGGGSPELYEVPADPELQEMIIEACAKFWQQVQTGNPPEPVTYQDAVARFGRSTAQGAVVASQDDLVALNELRIIRDRIKLLEADEEHLKAEVIKALGDSGDTLVDVDGTTLATYKLANGRKMFDYKAFEKDHKELYEQYLKHGEAQRRFLLK